ncbi:MAG TPA: AI-2E family transporter [Stenomitos sp.]
MNRNWSESFFRSATFLLWIGLGYVALQAMAYMQEVLTVLVSAMLVAYVLQMAVEPLSRRMPRWLAVGLVVALFVLVAGIGVSLLVPLLVGQIQMLLGHLPGELVNVQAQLNQLSERLASRQIQADLRLDTWLLPRLEGLGQNVATNLPGLLMGSFSGFFSTAMILVCAFYFLKDGPRLWRSVMALMPPRVATQGEYLRIELDHSLNRYLRGQLLNASVVMLAASMSFTLLGMDYGIVAGLIWGTAEIIPYFGLYLGLGTALSLAALQGGAIFGKVLFAGLLIWWIKDNIIAPRVMSHTTGLHPVLIIAAVLMGGKVAGFLGILLAIPVTAVIVTTLRFWLKQQRERDPVLAPAPPTPETPLPQAFPEI